MVYKGKAGFKDTRPPGAQRWSFQGKGRVLKLKDGLIVVPFQQTQGGWYCVTLNKDGPYPRTGYNILVFDDDIMLADEIEVEK